MTCSSPLHREPSTQSSGASDRVLRAVPVGTVIARARGAYGEFIVRGALRGESEAPGPQINADEAPMGWEYSLSPSSTAAPCHSFVFSSPFIVPAVLTRVLGRRAPAVPPHPRTQSHTHTHSHMHTVTHMHGLPSHTQPRTQSPTHAQSPIHAHSPPCTHTVPHSCTQSPTHTHSPPLTHTVPHACTQFHMHAHV